MDVPSTENALTFATPASTTYRDRPSGDTWASNGRRPAGLEKPVEPAVQDFDPVAGEPVEPTRLNEPSAATA